MIVDCLGTLGATKRIDHQVVPHVGDPHDIGDDAFGNAPLALGADSSTEMNRSGLHGHLDVIDVESPMLGESFTNETSQLLVAQVLDVINVLEVARHLSPRGCTPVNGEPGWVRR